jgi:hypothetical protein
MPIFINNHGIKWPAENELSEQLPEKLTNVICKDFESVQLNIKRKGLGFAENY